MFALLTAGLMAPLAGGGSASPITFVGVASNTSTGNNMDINVPAGVQDGDLLLYVSGGEFDRTYTVPGGWTLHEDLAASPDLCVAYRIANAEPASYNFSINASNDHVGMIAAFRGVDDLSPIDVYQSVNEGLFETWTSPSVTTTVENCMLVAFGGVPNGFGNLASIDADLTELVNLNQGGYAGGGGYQAVGGAGLQAGYDFVRSVGNSYTWSGMTLALKPASNTPAFVGASDFYNSGTTVTLDVPAGVQDGDFLMVLLSGDGGGPETITPPAGWTEALAPAKIGDPNGNDTVAAYYRVASSEPASYAWTWTGADGDPCSGMMMAFRNIDTANPFDVHEFQVRSTGTTTHTFTAITTTVANAMLVGMRILPGGDGFTSTTPASPGNGSFDADVEAQGHGGAGGFSHYAGYGLQETAGNTGDQALGSPSNRFSTGWYAALRPAPAGGGGITDPTDIANLEGWYDAFTSDHMTLSGSEITQWDDRSGNARHITTITGAPLWTDADLGNGGASDLDGVKFRQDALAQFFSGNGTPFTVVWVARVESASQDALFSANNGTPLVESWYDSQNEQNVQLRDDAGTLIKDPITETGGTNYYQMWISDGSTVKVRRNGAEVASVDITTLGQITLTSFSIGDRPNGGAAIAAGALGEFMIYSRALTTSEIADMETYLADRWGL